MTTEDVSPRVVEQRVRNRIIEQLELAGSFELQRECEKNAPAVHVPYDVINGWEDWVRPGAWPLEGSPGALSEDEVAAIRAFTSVWDAVADEIPRGFPTLAEVQAMPAWSRLRDAAIAAHAVFARRGRLSEDREELD